MIALRELGRGAAPALQVAYGIVEALERIIDVREGRGGVVPLDGRQGHQDLEARRTVSRVAGLLGQLGRRSQYAAAASTRSGSKSRPSRGAGMTAAIASATPGSCPTG